MKRNGILMFIVFGAAAAAGCATPAKEAGYDPPIDPANFVRTIDNTYFPLIPGTVFRYRSTGDDGVEDTMVTHLDGRNSSWMPTEKYKAGRVLHS